MALDLLVNQYQYKEKSVIDRFADFCLTPCRYFFQGRKIEIITVQDPIKPGYEEFVNEYPNLVPRPRDEVYCFAYSDQKTGKTLLKTCAAIVCLVPGLFIGSIFKILNYSLFSQFRQFSKISLRYECIYSLKKTVQEKMKFQLGCARLQQEQQKEMLSEQINDPTILSEIKNLKDKINFESFENGFVAETIGFRKTMEDAHINSKFEITLNDSTYAIDIYGIFDGHGGKETAHFMKEQLINTLKRIFERDPTQELSSELITNTLTETCVQLDIAFRKQKIDKKEKIECGTTAIFSLIINDKIFTANVGDSRAIWVSLDKSKIDNSIIQLSEDAKLDNPRFTNSILKIGGEIVDGRAEGLACGRDIGLTGKALVSPRPKITCIEKKENSLLVIACDGLWDVLTTNEVGKILQKFNGEGNNAKMLVEKALDQGSKDNISVMVIRV